MNFRQIFLSGSRSRRTFRHDGRAARATSALTAAAMVALLVLGTSPATADDTAPDPSAETTASTDPTTEPTPTEPPAEEAPAVEAEPTEPAAESDPPAEESTPEPAEEAPAAPDEPIWAKASAVVAKVWAGTTIDVPCGYNSPDSISVPSGKFEIDGNTCLTGDPTTPAGSVGDQDWESLAYTASREDGDVKIDGLGDSTGFTQGSAETNHPQGWVGGHQPNAKNDIETGWGFSQNIGGKVYGYFGFTSGSQAGGTQEVNMEYNQEDPVPNGTGDLGVPDRTVGDLLFHFSMNGSAPLSFTEVLAWTEAAGGGLPAGCTAVSGYSPAAGWCPIEGVDDDIFHSAVSDDGQFAEGSIEISGLPIFDDTCSGEFGTIQMRTTTGGSWTSAMKDYVGPLAVNTPSSCGKLRIEKRNQDGQLVGGATFTISSNPNTTADDFDVTDNQAPDENNAPGIIEISGIEPGQTFTVTEKTPPTSPSASEWPKYENDNPLGDGTNPQTVGTGETATFTFTNTLIWAPLTASKTASGSYNATYNWLIDKVVKFGNGSYGPTATGTSSTGSAPFDYQVQVSQGAASYSGATLTGTVKVSNPNGLAVQANLEDQFPGFTCTFDGGDPTPMVPANAVNQAYAYTCAPTNASAKPADGTNTAKVKWSKKNYPQNKADAGAAPGAMYELSPTAGVTFTENATNKTVTVTDNKHTFDPAWTITWGDLPGGVYTRTYTRTVTGTSGTCVDDTNIAKVMNGQNTLAQDSATARLCVGADLEVTKNATGRFTRTYLWNIRKVSCFTEDSVVVTGCEGVTPTLPSPANPGYTVEVSSNGHTTTGYQMSGQITVQNPNDWEDVTLTDLVDDYLGSAGETCAITTLKPWTVEADDSRIFDYNCTFAQQSPPSLDGTNRATATWDKAAAATPNSSASGTFTLNPNASWTETSINKTVYVYDQLEGGSPVFLDSVTWSPGMEPVFLHPTHNGLTAPEGECVTYTDQAWLGSAQSPTAPKVAGPDDADVRVCNDEGLAVTGQASTSFTRTYLWDLDKQIWDEDTQNWSADDTESSTQDTFSHEFKYRLVVDQMGSTDSLWKLTGSVTVKNENSDPGIPAISATVTQPATVGGVAAACTARIAGSGDSFSGSPIALNLASGASATIEFECTFATAPGAGTYTPSITTGALVVGNGSSPVAFSTPTTEVDKVVTLVDDMAGEGTPGEYGPFDAADGDPEPIEYTKTFTAENTGCDGNEWTNTATLSSEDSELEIFDDTDATICPNPGTWKVWKTSNPPSGDVVLPGSQITYTLHADKTGGVDPTNVVVLDELGGLLPYVTMPAELPTGVTWLDDDTLRWDVGTLSGEEKAVTFTVTVKNDAVGVTMPNLITSDGSDNCPPPGAEPLAAQLAEIVADENEELSCDTVHDTPHYTLQKSSDQGAVVLPGATIKYTLEVHNDSGVVLHGFTVSDDLSDVVDDAVLVKPLAEDLTLNGAETELTWHHAGDVAPGGTVTISYEVTVKDHQWGATLHNQATPEDLVGDCVIDQETEDVLCDTTTRTPNPTGQLTVVAKRQFTFNGSEWVEMPNGAAVAFGEKVKYIVTVRATGPRAFRNVVVSDFMPGFNADEAPGVDLTTAPATLVPGSIKCVGDFLAEAGECEAGINAQNLLTWKVGAVEGSDRVVDAGLDPETMEPRTLEGRMEFIANFPSLPDPVPYPANGIYRQTTWNIGYLDWDGDDVQVGPERLARSSAARAAAVPTVHRHHDLRSQPVWLTAASFEAAPPPAVEPQAPEVLPATGGPDRSLIGLGVLLAVVGGAVVIFDRRRQRRS